MLARFFHQSSTHVQRHTRSNVTIAPPSCKQRLKGIKHSYTPIVTRTFHGHDQVAVWIQWFIFWTIRFAFKITNEGDL